jgi:hypothetical protein
MKKTYFTIILIMIAFQLSAAQKKSNEPGVKSDTLVYSLLIIDPGFESWLATQPPMDLYSNDYYALKNSLYVSEWNRRYNTAFDKDLYDNYIEYNPRINYGVDLNYKLYYYFKYFEKTNHIRLLDFLK